MTKIIKQAKYISHNEETRIKERKLERKFYMSVPGSVLLHESSGEQRQEITKEGTHVTNSVPIENERRTEGLRVHKHGNTKQ